MKLLVLMILLLTLSACSSNAKVSIVKKNHTSNFEYVWSEVASDPYEKLPQTQVSYFKLSSKNGDIANDAKRTLNSDADILEPFEKLAHPNGICFKGIWKIDRKNPYSGYFKKGSEAHIIARASTAMSNTKRGSTRAFGFAAKLFATRDLQKPEEQTRANFFLIDDLGGTSAKHYRDVALTNEPPVSVTMEVLSNLAYAVKVANTFEDADKNPSIRQLYQISYLGENKDTKVSTPKWLKLEASDAIRVNAEDFREELQIKGTEVLSFDISVASKIIEEKKDWKKIGTIKLDESVTSLSCDKRLHFQHPKFRSLQEIK